MDLHDFIKDLKHGYTKVVDHACREIRLGHLTRTEAIILVKYYQSKKPKNIELFLKWLGVKQTAFNFVLDNIRNKNIWERNKNWRWVKKKSLVPNDSTKDDRSFEPFTKTKKYKSSDSKEKYILIGRGKRE